MPLGRCLMRHAPLGGVSGEEEGEEEGEERKKRSVVGNRFLVIVRVGARVVVAVLLGCFSSPVLKIE